MAAFDGGSFGRSLLSQLNHSIKRKVFVSYHHAGDQGYYNRFSATFADGYEAIQDSSLDRRIDSKNPEYVMRRIRENHITGTSCTIVLCGMYAGQRKYLDWEVKATLDKQHGLVGIRLPTNPVQTNDSSYKPERLQDNINSGYAVWGDWDSLATGGVNYLTSLIETANAKPKSSIENDRVLKPQNG